MRRPESYAQFIERKRAEYGTKFSDKKLAPQFVPYFESGERIKVVMSYGETVTGTVGVTTGWVPCFLLMARVTAYGSSRTLGAADCIVAVKRNGRYVELSSRGIPASHPVRPLGPGEPATDRVTCGACGRSWDDAVVTSMTPAPAARCPFENWHNGAEVSNVK